MKPLRVRPYSPADFQACRELYTLNEPGRFPPGVLPEFEEILQSGRALFLVAEKDGSVCGCGGIYTSSDRYPQASLFFGLIHPEMWGQGIGTTLLLARLSLLPKYVWIVTMFPVAASVEFYRRFNFREFGLYDHPVAGPLMLYFVRVSPKAIDRCGALLAKAGVTLDVGNTEIPHLTWRAAQK